MRTIFVLTRRSILLFLRDKATVFFSFLSTIILIALYFFFIGRSYADGMTEAVGEYLSKDAIFAMVYIQMIVGVLVLNSLSLSIGAFSTIAHDFESKKTDSFLLTPIKSSELLISYFFGGFVISFVLNFFTWLASLLIIGMTFGYWVGVITVIKVILILIFASMISCSLMLLFTASVKSSAAIGVFSGVAGTFLGFLCGIYMPYEMLGKGIEKVGSVLPHTHITIWLKQIVLGDAFKKLNVAAEARQPMLESFSSKNIGLAGLDIPLTGTLVYTALIALICLFAAGKIVKSKLKSSKR